jgi:hypothetical protein
MATQTLPVKGELGILYIYDETAYKPVACLTSTNLSSTLSIIESQTKCDPGLVKKQAGTFAYSITGDGEYIDTTSVGGQTTKASHDALLALQMSKDQVTWKLDTGIGASGTYFGYGIISDLSLEQGSGDEISTFSITIDGSGEILTTDPNAAP